MKRYLFRVINVVQKLDIWPIALRRAALRSLGVKIASTVNLMSDIDFVEGPLRLEENVFINRGAVIDAAGGIVIEADVHIGFGAKILTSTHEVGGIHRRAGPLLREGVRIRAGTWIGAGVVILPGVDIAPGVVVAAGAVVRSDLDRSGMYAGVPARFKKVLE